MSVSSSDGWTATYASSPAVPLDSGTATVSVAVDTRAAAELLDAHFAEIGAAGGQATLAVNPVVEGGEGALRGQAFVVGSPGALSFTMDANSLRPAGELGTAFTPSAQIPVAVDEVVPRTAPLLRWSLPVTAARVLAATVLGLAPVAVGLRAWVGGSFRGGLAERFVVRNAGRIVPVVTAGAVPSGKHAATRGLRRAA